MRFATDASPMWSRMRLTTSRATVARLSRCFRIQVVAPASVPSALHHRGRERLSATGGCALVSSGIDDVSDIVIHRCRSGATNCGAAHFVHQVLLLRDRQYDLGLEVDRVATTVAEKLHSSAEPKNAATWVVELEHRPGLPGAVARPRQIGALGPNSLLAVTGRGITLRHPSASPEGGTPEIVAAEDLIPPGIVARPPVVQVSRKNDAAALIGGDARDEPAHVLVVEGVADVPADLATVIIVLETHVRLHHEHVGPTGARSAGTSATPS